MKKITLVLFAFFLATVSYAQKKEKCTECNYGKKVVRCDNCHKGVIYCTTCDYTGVVSHDCSSCYGSGQTSRTISMKCDVCKGRGYERVSKEKPCSCRGGKRPVTRNGQTVYIDCSRCGGVGYKIENYNENCSYCGGDGYDGTETVYNTCSSCNGNGKVEKTCSVCQGKGGNVCDVCKGYANIEVDCERCYGEGWLYVGN